MHFQRILLIVMACSIVFTPALADARRGGGEAVAAGLCIGLPLGWLIGSSRPAMVGPPPPPPMCYRTVPGHYETRWDPYQQRYFSVYVYPYTESFPCR